MSHHDLSDEEKLYIDDWVPNNMTPSGRIEWKQLRYGLRNRHGFLRPENMVKNYWYSKQNRQSKSVNLPGPIRTRVTRRQDIILPIPINTRINRNHATTTPYTAIFNVPPLRDYGSANHRLLHTLLPDFNQEIVELPIDV